MNGSNNNHQYVQPEGVFHPLFATVVFPASVVFVAAVWSPPLMYSTMAEWMESWQTALFSHVCHQQIDRSYLIRGIPLAVCTRCTGMYSGLFLGMALFSNFSAFVAHSKRYITLVFLAGFLMLVTDGFANMFSLWQTCDVARSLTGLLWGITIGMLMIVSLLIPRKLK